MTSRGDSKRQTQRFLWVPIPLDRRGKWFLSHATRLRNSCFFSLLSLSSSSRVMQQKGWTFLNMNCGQTPPVTCKGAMAYKFSSFACCLWLISNSSPAYAIPGSQPRTPLGPQHLHCCAFADLPCLSIPNHLRILGYCHSSRYNISSTSPKVRPGAFGGVTLAPPSAPLIWSPYVPCMLAWISHPWLHTPWLQEFHLLLGSPPPPLSFYRVWCRVVVHTNFY